jgi:hypothetical protein
MPEERIKNLGDFLEECGAVAEGADEKLEVFIAPDTGTRIILARPTSVRLEYAENKVVIEAESERGRK